MFIVNLKDTQNCYNISGISKDLVLQVTKKDAFTPEYVSRQQLTIEGFEMPFEQHLSGDNRWAKLAHRIPWNTNVNPYNQLFHSREGRPPISERVILGAIIIKHIGNFTDRETVAQIAENPYMQYFLGYSSFMYNLVTMLRNIQVDKGLRR